MPFVTENKIVNVEAGNQTSVFRKTVLDSNYDKLRDFEFKVEENKKFKLNTKQSMEAERLIYNFLSSAEAWRNRWQKVFRKIRCLDEEEIMNKLEEEYNANKIAFMSHLRNFVVHNDSPELMFKINDGKRKIYIKKDYWLDKDVQNAEQNIDQNNRAKNNDRAEKMSDFYRSQNDFIDILDLAKGYHQAIVETDKMALRECKDLISEI